jgi:hypothetical protein
VARPAGDDAVPSPVRALVVIVAAILLVAGVLLTLWPGETEALWAWPMGPEVTSLAVGGGYLAGAVLFVRAAVDPRWHRVALAFPAATLLTTGLLVATLLHWEAFSHGYVSFWTWLVVYLVTPVLLPAVWLALRGRDPGEAPRDTPVVPERARRLLGAIGAIQLAAAVAFFVRPALAIEVWPWTLSPLTARTLASFLAFIGAMWLAFVFEARWSALQLHVEAATLGLVLVGIGAVRAAGDLTAGPVATATFSALLGGSLLVLGLVQFAMRRSVSADSGSAAARDRDLRDHG